MATPAPSASRSGTPRTMPSSVTARPDKPVAGSAMRVSSPSRAWTPAGGGAPAAAAPARPASVASPVATTTASAVPASTVVPSYSMLGHATLKWLHLLR